MIDPRIALMGQAPQIETAQAAQGGAAQVQNLQNIGQLQQGELAMQPGQLKAQSLANQTSQQQLDQTKALNAAYAGAFTPGANGGAPSLDTDKLTSALALGGHGSAIPGVMKGVLENQKTAADLATAKTKLATDEADYFGGIGSTVAKAQNDPRLFLTMATHAVASKAIDPTVAGPIIQQLEASLQADPTGAQAKTMTAELTAHLIAQSPAQQRLIAESQTSQSKADVAAIDLDKWKTQKPAQQLAMASQALKNTTNAADYAAVYNQLPAGVVAGFDSPANWTPQSAAKAQAAGLTSEQAQTAANAAGTLKETQARDANTASNEAANLKLRAMEIGHQIANKEVLNLTPAALDQMATYFGTTGQLPPLGMGSAAAQARSAIINRAAEKFPNITIASNAANFQANKSSLKNVQGTLDTLTAFENTGLKNLRMFTDAAASIPDTGVPWINAPVRMLDEKLVGSSNMAVVNAARQVALREIARVTNDPKLSGVLSDASRKEVQDLSPTNATLPQIVAVAKTLQTDMANVHQSLSDQRDAINSRINVNPTGAAPAAGPAAVTPVPPHVEALRTKYKY